VEIPVYFKSPLIVTVDITYKCNARCIMCYNQRHEATQGELTLRELEDLMRQLGEMDVYAVDISGGEPLCRPDVLDIVAAASSNCKHVSLGTNGLLLDKKLARNLRAAGLDGVMVSVHSLDSAKHDQIRGVKGSFNKAIAALDNALEAGLRVGVSTTLMRINYDEIFDIIYYCLDRGLASHSTSLLVTTGFGQQVEDLTSYQYRKFLTEWTTLRHKSGGCIYLESHHESLSVLVDPTWSTLSRVCGCVAGWSVVRVTATGEVTPCNLLPVSCGDIKSQNLAFIWHHSPVLRQLRDRKHLKGRCGRCEHKDVCGGCRSTAYAYTGDVFAQDPRCWHEPAAPKSVQPNLNGKISKSRNVFFRREWSYILAIDERDRSMYDLSPELWDLLELCDGTNSAGEVIAQFTALMTHQKRWDMAALAMRAVQELVAAGILDLER